MGSGSVNNNGSGGAANPYQQHVHSVQQGFARLADKAISKVSGSSYHGMEDKQQGRTQGDNKYSGNVQPHQSGLNK